MNSKQRMRAAMRRQPVDRVPVMCQLAIGHYLLNTDVRPVELWFTSEGFARAAVELQRRYRFDGILINFLSSACSVAPRVPAENLTVLVEASELFGRPDE
jgi:uroporphyrinogen-III decarboxylase